MSKRQKNSVVHLSLDCSSRSPSLIILYNLILTKNNIQHHHHKSTNRQAFPPKQHKFLIQPLITKLIMIQKSRVYPEFEYPPEKYQIDHFHNPYLAKLSMKVTPKKIFNSPYYFVSPLSSSNNLYLSHSLPVLKNQKLRIALIWKQYLSHKFARANFGISVEHNIHEKYRIKALILGGTNSQLDLQFSKKIRNNLNAFLGYSGFVQNSSLYSSFNVGVRKGMYSFLLTHKLMYQTQFKIGLNHQILEGVNIGTSISGNILEPQKLEADISLNQQIDPKSSACLSLICNPYYRQIGLKVEFERQLTKNHRVILCSEFTDSESVLYLGYKNLNFNFAFPFLVINNPIPTIIGLIGFGLAYLYRKKQTHQKYHVQLDGDEPEEKKESDRVDELKLISDKAADIYEKERILPKGLLIEEAYIGPEDQIQEFMHRPDRHILLLRSEEHRSKFVDLTVSLRFYVTRSQLRLRKGDKSKILGFYRQNKNCNRIGIRYSRNGIVKVQYFNYDDPITIKKLD